MAFKKILVALDRLPQASVVFEKALEIAQKDEGNLMVVHYLSLDVEPEIAPLLGTSLGLEPTRARISQRLLHESLHKDIEQAQEWLQLCCQQAIVRGVPTKFDCRVGSPGSSICDLAQTWDADLIVLGRRGRGGLVEMLLGSVSNYVVHHAPCSVLVVQGVTPPTVDSGSRAT